MKGPTASKAFFFLCLSFIGGIGIRTLFEISQLLLLVVLIGGIFLIGVFWKYKRAAFLGFCVVFVVLGVLRYQGAQAHLFPFEEELAEDQRRGERVVFIGQVVGEPEKRIHSVRLVVRPENISERSFPARMQGKVLVTTDRFSDYGYGDMLKISGNLKTPGIFDHFNYREFLARQDMYWVMANPTIELLERGRDKNIASKLKALMFAAKAELRETLHLYLSKPGSAILEGMILGDEGELSDEMKDALNKTGTRHIIAISGMHIVILTALLLYCFLGIGFSRSQAFYLTSAFMVLYIISTGGQPSAVRAGIMGGLFLLSQHIGRMNVAWRCLVFAGAGMFAFDPFVLKDVGFQLSFMAVLGLIFFSPYLNQLFRTIPSLFQLREILSATIAAQVFTLPILLYNFGQVSVVALAANILIIPISAPLLAFGFLFLVAGTIFAPFGFVLSFPVAFLLAYMSFVVDFFAQFSFASLHVENVSPLWLALFYVPLGFFLWKFRTRHEFPGLDSM